MCDGDRVDVLVMMMLCSSSSSSMSISSGRSMHGVRRDGDPSRPAGSLQTQIQVTGDLRCGWLN